jgi:hypothetical protein
VVVVPVQLGHLPFGMSLEMGCDFEMSSGQGELHGFLQSVST